MEYKILGIDTGIAFAVAILDLDGRVYLIKCGKGKEKEAIFEEILANGNIKYVAFDKAKAPKEVKQISAMLGAELCLPGKDLSTKRKERLMRKFEKRSKIKLDKLNKHEKDALSSALYCYSLLESRIKKLTDKLPEVTQKEKYDYLNGKYISEIKKEISKKDNYGHKRLAY